MGPTTEFGCWLVDSVERLPPLAPLIELDGGDESFWAAKCLSTRLMEDTFWFRKEREKCRVSWLYTQSVCCGLHTYSNIRRVLMSLAVVVLTVLVSTND